MKRVGIVAIGLIVVLAMMVVAGVSAQDETTPPPDAPFLGISFDNTAEQVVVQVMRHSPAALAGLRDGDVIVAINDEAVTPQTIAEIVGAYAAGDTITLTIERDGESLEIEVTLGARPNVTIMTMPNRQREGRMMPPTTGTMPMPVMPFGGRGMFFSHNPDQGRLGVVYAPIDEALAEEMSLPVTEGAVILEVEAESPAEEAGFLVDDVVIAVNDEPVDEERTLQDRMVAYEVGDVVTFTVLRGDETLTLTATLGEWDMTMFGGRFGNLWQFHDFDQLREMMPNMREFGDFGELREMMPNMRGRGFGMLCQMMPNMQRFCQTLPPVDIIPEPEATPNT